MRKTRIALALMAGMTASIAAQATLIDRGGGLIYDDVLHLAEGCQLRQDQRLRHRRQNELDRRRCLGGRSELLPYFPQLA